MKNILSALVFISILTGSIPARGIEYNKEETFPDLRNPGKTVAAITNFSGLGCVIDKVDGKYIIAAIIPGSGAEKAKLHINDEILMVSGKEVSNSNIDDVAKQIRGNPNTKVVLTILRAGAAVPIKVTVTCLPLNPNIGS